jgi:hypothetical protein
VAVLEWMQVEFILFKEDREVDNNKLYEVLGVEKTSD